MKIELSGIPENLLTRFIANQQKPADAGRTAWCVSLLSLTSIPVTQIAEALGITTRGVRASRSRNKEIVANCETRFIKYFIVEAQGAFNRADEIVKKWEQSGYRGDRPNLYPADFDLQRIISPRLTVAIMLALRERGLIHLMPFVPFDGELISVLRGVFRRSLFENIRSCIIGRGDKTAALTALAMLEEE